MSSRRVLKAAEAIREVVSMTILTDLRDPRVEGVTVTFVDVSPDMRQAKVHVSIMGSEAQQKLCLHGLRSSAGYIQSKISDRIDTRYTPKLQFVIDEGVKKSLAINQMLRELLPDTNPSPAAVTDDDVSQDNGSSEDDLPDDDSSDDDSSHGDAPDDES